MSDELFDIYFSGKVIDQDQVQTVKQKVGKLFNANEAVLNKLFSGQSTKIKKAVDMETAIKYRVKFREAGAIVEIRPSQSAPPSQAASETIPQSGFTAENTGTTPEAATASEPPPAAGLSREQATTPALGIEASLAMPGSVIDETPEVPPAHYNTDQFDLSAANTGSLEEYAETVIAAPVPDISSLDIDQSSEPLDTTPEPAPLVVDTSNMAIDAFSGDLDQTPPPPPANIDTGNLTASEANTGSLEEFDSRPEPIPVPDTSKLNLA